MSAPEPAASGATPGGGVEEPRAGWALVRLSWAGTTLFAILAVLAVAVDRLRALSAGVDLVLFAGGVVAFLAAYARAVSRSRTDAIGIGGLFFLAGEVAPSWARRHLLGSLGVEVVVSLAAALAAPYTPVAFGVLVPMWGLGLAGLWGARHGAFGPRAAG